MKSGFVLYTDYLDTIQLLSESQRGILLTALMLYASGQDAPEMDGMTMMAFSFISKQIDRDSEKYEETRKRRSEAGRMGGRPKKEEDVAEEEVEKEAQEEEEEKAKKAIAFPEKQEKAKKANGFSEKQTKAKKADNDNVNVNDNDIKEKQTKRKFHPPSVEEVRAYCEERKNRVDPEGFVDFYASKGWMVGKSPMKDWRASVRTWERGTKTRQEETAKPSVKNLNNFHSRRYDMDALEAQLSGI